MNYSHFFRSRCRLVNWAFFAFVFYPPLVAVIMTRLLPPDINKVEKINNDNVYHSAEVFRTNYAEMLRKFKIYVYSDEVGHVTMAVDYDETEGHFLKNIMDSSFLTDDPDQAHLFFIPISCQKLHTKVLLGMSYEEMASWFGKYVEGVIHKYPHWNRTLGTDHFFLSCHDFDVGAARFIPLLVKNSIRVLCSSTYNAAFIPHKDFSHPPVILPYPEPKAANDRDNRRTLGYWAGFAHSNITTTLVNLWSDDIEFDIENSPTFFKGTSTKLYSSKFCICPVEADDENACLTMAILHRCVPVILADYFDLPFNDVLNWQKFSVTLKERDVYLLKDVLKAKVGADYKMLYGNLLKVQRHFHWNTLPVEYDAFHMIMYDLWLRRNTIRY